MIFRYVIFLALGAFAIAIIATYSAKIILFLRILAKYFLLSLIGLFGILLGKKLMQKAIDKVLIWSEGRKDE